MVVVPILLGPAAARSTPEQVLFSCIVHTTEESRNEYAQQRAQGTAFARNRRQRVANVPQVTAALRLEDENRPASTLGATTATSNAPTVNITGNEFPMVSAGASGATRDASAATQDPFMAANVFGDTLGASGGGGGQGQGQARPSPTANGRAAARSSKLAMAEAEAYADVQVPLSQRQQPGRGRRTTRHA